MKMKELSELTDVSDRTIRFYISDGIFVPEKYSENYQGRRSFDFTENDVAQLKRIAVLRKYGFSLKDIKSLMDDDASVNELLNAHINELKQDVNSDIEIINSMVNVSQENPQNINELCAMLDNPYIAKKPIPFVDNTAPYRHMNTVLTIKNKKLKYAIISISSILFIAIVALVVTQTTNRTERLNPNSNEYFAGICIVEANEIKELSSDTKIEYKKLTDNVLLLDNINNPSSLNDSGETFDNEEMWIESKSLNVYSEFHTRNDYILVMPIFDDGSGKYYGKNCEYWTNVSNSSEFTLNSSEKKALNYNYSYVITVYNDAVNPKEESMELSGSLKYITKDAKTINDYVNGFEVFCQVESGDSEEVCFLEAGNYDFSGEDEFYFSLVRQYKANPNDDEYVQVHMDIIFDPIKANNQSQIWSDEFDNYAEFFNAVKSSEVLQYINDNNLNPKRIDFYADET
jgi:MerR family mercuric resistance operon transcriptional regulator